MTKQNNIEGLENAPKIMQDFVFQLQDNKTVVLHKKTSWISKYNPRIIKILEKPYNFIKWFVMLSIVVALIAEQIAWYYV